MGKKAWNEIKDILLLNLYCGSILNWTNWENYGIPKEQQGCIAYETERGKTLAALVSYLGLKTLDKDVQILTLTDMDTFGEYKPYKIVQTELEFISRVLTM